MVARTPNSVIALAVGVLAGCLGLTPPASNSALAQTSNDSSVSSWFNRNGSTGGGQPAAAPANTSQTGGPIRRFSARVKKAFTAESQNTTGNGSPKPRTQDDAISLSKPAKPRPDFYISLGRIQERANNPAAAVEQYKRALELEPDSLTALMSLARLYDRQGQLADALKRYQQATTAHPTDGPAFNDQGLCYARQKQYPEAIASLRKAVELRPDRVLYRNNLATILVETGQIDQAFQTLADVHGAAVAHYNIGFLLNKRGATAPALDQFKLATASDPKFEAAGQWVDTLTIQLAAEQNIGTQVASGQPSVPATPPARKIDAAPAQALAGGTPSPAVVKAAETPARPNPVEPPAATNTVVASAEVSAIPIAALPPTPTAPPPAMSNATPVPLPSALAVNHSVKDTSLAAPSVPTAPPVSSVAVRDMPVQPMAPPPAISAKPAPTVPPPAAASPGAVSQSAPQRAPSIVQSRTDQTDNGQPPKRDTRYSQPTELVAQRPTRLPPTPDEIQVYSQNVPAVNAANAIVPLPPVDPGHYPPSRY